MEIAVVSFAELIHPRINKVPGIANAVVACYLHSQLFQLLTAV